MKPLIAEAFGKKIDQAAIFGVDKPTTWGDDILSGAKTAKNTIAQGTGKDLAADVAALGKMLAKEGYALNGFASQPGLNWELTELRDTNNRPIYTPNLTDKQPANLYGYPCNEVLNGSWDPTKAVLLRRLVEVHRRHPTGHHLQGVRPRRHLQRHRRDRVQRDAAGQPDHASGHARRLPSRQSGHPRGQEGHPVPRRIHPPAHRRFPLS